MLTRARNQARLLAYYRDFIRRTPHPANPPLRLWVDISSRCNLKCIACPQRMLPPEQRRDLDPEVLESIVEQVRDRDCQVSLFHRGEALLHPELPWWIKRFKEAGCWVRIHTNATLLTPERVAGLIWAGPDMVTCSVDSLDPVQYAAQRPGAELGRTLEGIERLLKARRDLDKQKPTVNLLTMGDQRPSARQYEALSRLKRLGLKRHLHRRPHNWGGSVGAADTRVKTNTCTFPWYGLAVLSDGRVTPCPQDFFGEMELGRVEKNSLWEIWQGDQMRALRKAHACHDLGKHPACYNCDRIRRPTFMGLPVEHLVNIIRDLANL